MRRMRTVNQAAAEIKLADPGSALGSSWIRKMIASGRLKYVAAGNRHLVAMEDLEALIDLGMQVVAPEVDDCGPRRISRIS